MRKKSKRNYRDLSYRKAHESLSYRKAHESLSYRKAHESLSYRKAFISLVKALSDGFKMQLKRITYNV
jgi:hypothetical protein